MQNNSDRHVEFILTDKIANIIIKNHENISIISARNTAQEIYKKICRLKYIPIPPPIKNVKPVKMPKISKNNGTNSFLNILTFIATLRFFFIGK